MTNRMSVREGVTYLDVGERSFIAPALGPALGPDTFWNHDSQIPMDEKPTFADLALLADSAWQNPKGKYESQIIDILRNRWLWGFTSFTYVSKGADPKLRPGVYIQDRPETKNGRIVVAEPELLKILEQKDLTARYVELGFKSGEMDARELERNPLVVGAVGEQGAEQLARASKNYSLKPFVYVPSFENSKEPITRVAALGSNYYGDGLDVDCNDGGDVRGGCVLRVRGREAPIVAEGDARDSLTTLDSLPTKEILKYLSERE